ncbi:MAG: efflux RND transporter periplasmic adaptor subunit [Saprospiraceae bacterium]|nr:efflux RND transporter periplasmic adaptor subunit [Saprospiraceae bacterium]
MIVLLLIGALLGCGEKEAPAPPPPPDVNVVAVGKRNVPIISEYIGQTYGATDVEIQSRIDGWVTAIHFKEGDRVRKGQLLYSLDDQPLLNDIDQAKARLTSATSTHVKARSDLSRVEPLTAMNALSKRELDAAQAAEKAAASEVQAAQAALNNAQVRLGYTKVKSPIDGVIGISNVQVGDYVRIMSSQPLNTVSALGSVRVRFSVSEQDFLRYTKAKGSGALSNFPMELVLSDGTSFTEPGRLDLTNREIDPQTGSILVQAVFQNARGLLKPGQYVKLRLTTQELKDAIVVPQQAVNQMQEVYMVYVLNENNTISPRQVKMGPRIGANWVVTEGLRDGERVAVLGSTSIKPDVTIYPVVMPWNYDSTSVSTR